MKELREFEEWVKRTENEWRPALLVVQQYIREHVLLVKGPGGTGGILRDDGQGPRPLMEITNA